MVTDSMRRRPTWSEVARGPNTGLRRTDTSTDPTRTRSRRRLLERDAAIDELAGIFEHLGRNSSTIVLIEGIHGSGRTALLNTACRTAADIGIQVVRARAVQEDFAHPLAVADQVMTQLRLGGATGTEALRRCHGKLTDTEAQEMYELLLDRLVDAAHGQRLVVAVDDVDLASATSLEWLRYAAGRVGLHGVLFVATTLPPSRRLARHPLDPIRIDSGTRRIGIEPLSPHAVTHLVTERFGGDAAATGLPETCHRVTDGNPALLFALFDWLAEHGAAGATSDELIEATTNAAPVRVVRAMASRAYSAGPRGAEVLGAVALLDGVASSADIAAVTGLDFRQVDDIVEHLADTSVLEVDEPLRFVHPIVRSSVCAALTIAERRRVHGRCAALLDERGESHLRVASHLLDTPASQNVRWVEVLVSAGNRHIDDGDPELAEAMLRRAVSELADIADHPELAVDIAGLQARLGHADAVTTFSRHGPAARDIAVVTRGACTIATHLEESVVEVCDILGHVRDSLVEIDPDGAVRVAVCRSLLEGADGTTVDEIPLTTIDACTPATRTLLAVHRSTLDVDRVSGGTAEEIGVDLAATVVPSMLVSEQTMERHVAFRAVRALLATDRVGDAEDLVTRASSIDSVDPVTEVELAALRTQVALRRGDLPVALASLPLRPDAGYTNTVVADLIAPTTVHLLWSQGRLDEAEVFLARQLSQRSTLPSHRPLQARGWLALYSGDRRTALEFFLAAGQAAALRGIRNPAITDWRIGAARAAAGLGDHRQALDHAETAVQLAQRFGAGVPLARSLAALACAVSDQQIELLEEALELVSDASAPGLEAQIALELGRALRKHSAADEAIGVLRHAGDLSHRLAAPRLSERIIAELRAAGARPTHLALSGAESLTRAQARIARLAIDGFTNVQIAAQLFISVKTVESHLARTYAKLGVHSRRDLPTALADVDDPHDDTRGDARGDALRHTDASTRPAPGAYESR
ncbi:MAG TPA: LuxR C-terminal-related transcriptional regulator [Acidimicrobiales bacterium]|nr:LuxR C-terminal-related transcriptional regulator [Acidimicrobiales bacterium]